MDKIGNRIKQAMRESNKKQSDIIRETGINKGALSSYINNRYEPKQDNLYLIAKSLNVSPAWLLGYDVIKNSKQDKISSNEFVKEVNNLLNKTNMEDKQKNMIKAILENIKED